MFKSQSLDEFLAELSSHNPTPGGGTAAGFAAAMGTALFEMVANVVGGRDEAEKQHLSAFVADCETFRAEFLMMMDDDSLAFDGYMAATRLPKTTEEEKASRREAMQEALKSSTTSPLKLAVRVCDLVDLLSATFSAVPKAIASDLYVGAAMLEAGFEGAVANVYVNLAYLKDVTFEEETRATIQHCRQRVAGLSSFKVSIGRLLAIP